MMFTNPPFSALANELVRLRQRQQEFGTAALAEIRRSDSMLAERLREAFGAVDEKAAAWLVQLLLAYSASPVELLAAGKRREVSRMLVSIVGGLCA